jgi:hypothetical protein
MHNSALIRALVATACALPILTAGCKEEEPGPLFDEGGTWVLLFFRLADGDILGDFGSSLRQGKYMLYFDKEAEVVAAAACNDSMGVQGVKQSLCDLTKEQGGYYCRCFNYEFEESTMTWTEFVPKGQPRPPEPDEDAMAAGAVSPGTPVRIQLEEYSPDTYNDTYRFTPLPFGVFDSNGSTSQYVFQIRGASTFDATGCREVCGIAAPAE